MILSSSNQFKSMTPAQKAYVLSMLVNKVFQNPKDYGLNEDGILRIGDKLDFTKLFENTKEIKLLFEKAQQTIVPGGFQEKSILENDEKIASWIKENPNANITADNVGNILNNKSKEEKLKPKPEPVIITPETRAKEASKMETMSVLEKEKRESIHQEIEEAKQRLTHLENKNNDTRFVSLDSQFNQNIEAAFRNEINSIYGKNGLLGMGKTEGMKTKEWAEMARLPASKIIEYYTGDSAKSGLSPEIIKELVKSKSHEALMRQTAGLMERANGAVKPFANENMEQFIKRLGGYVLRTHLK
mgnify:CR=1 FL=1